jgi:hypothetical protein
MKRWMPMGRPPQPTPEPKPGPWRAWSTHLEAFRPRTLEEHVPIFRSIASDVSFMGWFPDIGIPLPTVLPTAQVTPVRVSLRIEEGFERP